MSFRRRLALDTSTLTQSVAIADGPTILGEIHIRRPQGRAGGHSASLLAAVHRLTAQCGLTLPDLDLFVCGLGPGSFTGLRIGLSCLKGIALSLDKPLVGLSSLEAIAISTGASGLVVPLLNARKKEVYAGAYRDGHPVLTDRAIGPLDLAQMVSDLASDEEDVSFAGEGLRTYGDAFEAHGWLLGPSFDTPHAGTLALMAQRLGPQDISAAAGIEPNYQRASDAERNANAGA